MKNPLAVALGKLAKGKPKNYSKDELERRRKLMEKLNLRRNAKLPRKRKPKKG